MISVLLVDDHPAICFALKILLEKSDEFTVTTSSGERLLQQIHNDSPDLLILDLELKNSDGLDILPRIKQNFPALKVLIFTNQPAQVYALRTLQAGADGFINKNVSLNVVESLCRLLYEGYQCFPGKMIGEMRAKPLIPEDNQSILSRLSDREIVVLNYLKSGKTNKEIADRLMLSNKTISTYKARILKKAGVDDLSILFPLLLSEEPCA